MSLFRVTLTGTKASGVVTHDGFLGKYAEFRIQRLSDRRSSTHKYEGHGGGKLFELRRELLIAAGGVVVEWPDPPYEPADLAWKEAIVNQALQQAERLQ
jgi:hypothetical protein